MSLSADDYIAIQQLYSRYAFSVDTGDLDAWAALWTEDGVLETSFGFRAEGVEALRAMAERTLADPNEAGYHLTANVVIEPAEHGANGTCYLLVVLDPDGNAPRLRHALYYSDEIVNRDGRWLFRRRLLGKMQPPSGQ